MSVIYSKTLSPSTDTPSDRFLRYSRQKLIALLAVTLLVGAGGLARE